MNESESGGGRRRRWLSLTGSRLKAFLLASRLATATFGLLQLSLVARLLPPPEYAAMAAATAVSAYLNLVAEPAILGYERLGNHDRGKDLASGPSAARPAALSQLTTVAVLGLAGLAVWALVAGEPWLAAGSVLWAASLVQMRWVSVQYLLWNEQQAFGLTMLVNSFSRLVAVVGAAYFFRDGYITLVVGALASIVATAIVSPPWRPMQWNKAGWGELARVGLPLTLAAVAWVSLNAWPTLVGSRLLDVDVFASYVAQASLGAALYGVTVGFVVVFGFPAAKRAWDSGDQWAARHVQRRFFGYEVALVPALALFTWFAGDWLTRLVLGPKYVGHTIMTVVLLAAALQAMSNIAGWLLRLDFRQRLVASITLSAAALQLGLTWYLTSRYELPGLMFSVLLVFTMQAIATILTSRPIRWGEQLAFVFALSVVATGLLSTLP